ncbi:restriction endonuclease subunit S [Aeromonas caviae]
MIAAEPKTTGQYQPYPEYKNTGLTWLGAIPNHWGLKRAKFVFKRVQRPVRVEDDIVTAFRDGQVTLRSNRRTEGFTNALQEIGYQGVRSGDLLIHAMDGFAGAIGISDSEGKCSPVCSVCIPISAESVNPYYYGYLVRQLAVTGFITSLSKGIRERSTEFRFSEFSPLELALPPVDEQHIVAAFLDHETARIDRLIAQQHRLIELLKEKRQAVISHAVTKGLNPDAPMKDSGVEWIGQVPEHWQCVPFGLLVSRADLGGNYLGGQEENGIPFLKMGNLGRGCIVLDKLECLEEGSSFDDAHRLSMGDFLFNTRNSLDLVGKVAVWHDELEFALYNSNLLRVRFKKDFISSPDFMGFVFNSSGALGWLALLAKGTTSVAAIYYKDLRSMVVPIPPVDEQNAISSFISKCLSRLDTLEEKAIQSINLMNERRTALISAAVTGKIDLRGWTPPADEVAA